MVFKEKVACISPSISYLPSSVTVLVAPAVRLLARLPWPLDLVLCSSLHSGTNMQVLGLHNMAKCRLSGESRRRRKRRKAYGKCISPPRELGDVIDAVP